MALLEGVKKTCLFISIIIGGCIILFSPFLKGLELKAQDGFFKLKGKKEAPSEIVFIEVDEPSIKALSYPIPRNLYAALLILLKEARVVGFDLFLSDPTNPAHDALLKEVLKRTENCILSIGFSIPEGKFFPTQRPEGIEMIERFSLKEIPNRIEPYHGVDVILPLILFLSAASGVGHINIFPDPDGVIRRMPLFIEYDGRIYPSLALMVASRLKGKPIEELSRKIPCDQKSQMLINFGKRRFVTYSLLELLQSYKDGRIGPEKFRNKAILIGATAPSLGDFSPTPIYTSSPNLFLHGEVISNILDEDFLSPLPFWLNLFLILLLGLLGGIIPSSSSVRVSAILILILMAGYLAFCFLLFLHGLLVNIALPPIASFLSYTISSVFQLFSEKREKEKIKAAFGKYVSGAVVDRILDKRDSFETLRRKELTILFSDIKDFSILTDKSEPEDISLLLNTYFDEMVKIVFEYEGTVDKFMGDGLLVFWGDPVDMPDHAFRAVSAALKMQNKVDELNKRWEREGRPTISIRIGINTGFVTVGSVGSKTRADYTILGKNVNLAQRLESKATPGKILISHRTFSLVQDRVGTKQLGEIRVKGESMPVKVYEVLSNV